MLPDPIEEDFPPSRYEPPDVSFGLDKDDLGDDNKMVCYLLQIKITIFLIGRSLCVSLDLLYR